MITVRPGKLTLILRNTAKVSELEMSYPSSSVR